MSTDKQFDDIVREYVPKIEKKMLDDMVIEFMMLDTYSDDKVMRAHRILFGRVCLAITIAAILENEDFNHV